MRERHLSSSLVSYFCLPWLELGIIQVIGKKKVTHTYGQLIKWGLGRSMPEICAPYVSELHSSRIGPNRPEKGNQERSTGTIINTGRTLASRKISV